MLLVGVHPEIEEGLYSLGLVVMLAASGAVPTKRVDRPVLQGG